MLKKGFTATSVEDICQKAGLTKGSFFYYFESKEHLGKAVLERFCCSSRQKIAACCCNNARTRDPLEDIYSYVDFAVKMSKDPIASKGCLMGAFAQELSDICPSIRDLCAEGFNEWAKMLKKDFIAAKAKYAPRASFDAQGLADHFIAIMEGSQILAKAKQNRKII